MLTRTLKLLVHADHDTLWGQLLDGVQHPGRYVSGVTEVRFPEKAGDVVIREMKLNGHQVREKITIDDRESRISREFLDHPNFSGTIQCRVIRTAVQSPVAPQNLEYAVEIQPKSYKTAGVVQGEEEILADLKEEMGRIKRVAEEAERKD